MKKRITDQLPQITWLILLSMLFITDMTAQYKPDPEIPAGRIYRISDKSTLSIAGTTNMNSFTCSCTEDLPAQIFYIESLDDEHCTTVFKETFLNLRIKSLDCGNKMMNKDMFKALNADVYPNIRIDLLQVSDEKCDVSGNNKGHVKYVALTRITINGKSNQYWLRVTLQSEEGNKIRFTSEKALKMTEFGITPPTAALGMVKVRDEIRISMDIEVVVE